MLRFVSGIMLVSITLMLYRLSVCVYVYAGKGINERGQTFEKEEEGIGEGLEWENEMGKGCNHIIISKIEEKERQQLILWFVIKLVTPEQRTRETAERNPLFTAIPILNLLAFRKLPLKASS